MPELEARTERGKGERQPLELVTPAPPEQPRKQASRFRLVPLLITLIAVAVATGLTWAMWDDYMAAPWTRDGTVRVYVVTMAPEVAGRIVELPIRDNQFVHKGDLLMVIEPTNYEIAVKFAQAAVEQAEAVAINARADSTR